MKKIVIALAAVLLTLGVSAQRGYGKGYYRGGGFRTRTYISAGIYSPYYYPGYYYGPAYPYYSRPSRLDMDIADIKADYRDKIWSARHDKSVSRVERRKNIRELKTARDKEIRDSERNYYKRRN
jgi:hypothetical protein